MSALRSLLAGLVDYAGLFPPAALPMPEAVRLYDAYRRGRSAWALGRFVLPIWRLAEFSDAAGPFLPGGSGAVPWRLSALAGADPAGELGEVLAFNARHAQACEGRARVDAVEVKTATPEAVDSAAATFEGFDQVCEVPWPAGQLEKVLGAIGATGGIAKLRAGGISPDAIPDLDTVARFLWGCARHGVAFKVTAGLHHALRGEYALTYDTESPRGTMHGLLNVLAAATAARTLADGGGGAVRLGDGSDTPPLVLDLLSEQDPEAFRLGVDGLAWRHLKFPMAEIESVRARFALSVGSCSFEEPLSEMQALAGRSEGRRGSDDEARNTVGERPGRKS